jgi:hypothetical protein
MFAQITLYEDWRQRAACFIHGSATGETFELRILNYLLRRYQHAPEAARPSRGPVNVGLFINSRAIVVNHHLRLKETADVKSRDDAESRVQAIVSRMHAAEPVERPASKPDHVDFVRSRWLNQRRAKLADDDAKQRMSAAKNVATYGDLEDIGMLLDLLALPVASDEGPIERDVLRWAVERLSNPIGIKVGGSMPWHLALRAEQRKRARGMAANRQRVALSITLVLSGIIGLVVFFLSLIRTDTPVAAVVSTHHQFVLRREFVTNMFLSSSGFACTIAAIWLSFGRHNRYVRELSLTTIVVSIVWTLIALCSLDFIASEMVWNRDFDLARVYNRLIVVFAPVVFLVGAIELVKWQLRKSWSTKNNSNTTSTSDR